MGRGFADVVGDYAVGLDEIGLDEIGDDMSELEERAAVRAAGGQVVRPQKPTGWRVQVMAASPKTVTAGSTEDVEYKPQRLIRVHSFVIPSDDAANWEITNIEIAQTSQFITKGAVPGLVFSEVADGRRSVVKFDSADVGNTLIVTVKNVDAVSHDFKAPFFATAIIRSAA